MKDYDFWNLKQEIEQLRYELNELRTTVRGLQREIVALKTGKKPLMDLEEWR